MNQHSVGSIPVHGGTVGASDAFAGCTIVNLPTDSDDDPCITNATADDLQRNTNCFVFEDTRRDFVLEIGNRIIRAHTDGIAGSVPYFSHPPGDVQTKIERLREQHLNGNAVEALVRFVYTRQIQIDDDNVHAVRRAAQFLKMENVAAACIDFIVNRINDQNVVHTLCMATASNDTVVVAAATNYVLANIVRLSDSSELSKLTADAFADVVRASATQSTSAEALFEEIFNWTDHDPPNRSGMLCELLEKVRFRSMTLDFLRKNVLTKLPRITNCTRVRQSILEAINDHVGPTDTHRLDCGPSPTTRGLEHQNREAVDRLQCVICTDRYRDILILPCQHLVLCGDCFAILNANPPVRCPCCRKLVSNHLQIYS